MIKLTDRLQKAINFAAECHRDQTRKNENNTPYISHPYSVMLTASEFTDNEDILIACLLHDIVEDCGVTFEEIEGMFGNKVKDIVYHVTEPKFFLTNSNPLTWKERKDNYLSLLQNGPDEALIVAACDKIHNMQSINRNLIHQGTFWFLDTVLNILEAKAVDSRILEKYKASLNNVKKLYS